MEPTAISDANGLICRGELYRTAFAAAGIPLYDATLYGLDWPSSGENALRVGKELGLSAENETAAYLVTRAEAAQRLRQDGMKKLCDWEKEYGYTKWDYTELLFSAGQISMESLGMLVRMTKEEQERYFHEFGSSRLINPRF